jgi:chromatin segregation and condensation protein Rec8/ScpA/Scc1 (kleisin family)
VDVTHLPRRALPLRPLLDRFRRLLREQGAFVFDDAVARLDRLEQAVAFWAVLELYRRGEVRIAQDEPFAPIRVAPAAAAGRRRAPAADDQAEAVA